MWIQTQVNRVKTITHASSSSWSVVNRLIRKPVSALGLFSAFMLPIRRASRFSSSFASGLRVSSVCSRMEVHRKHWKNRTPERFPIVTPARWRWQEAAGIVLKASRLLRRFCHTLHGGACDAMWTQSYINMTTLESKKNDTLRTCRGGLHMDMGTFSSQYFGRKEFSFNKAIQGNPPY